MTIKEYRAIEKAQEKCKHCIFLANVGGVYYCPFAGCIQEKKE